MAGPSPLLFDTYYHIYNRGINRENIFLEERNYLYFLQLYTRYLDPVTETFAYCLLRNHFHMLVRVKSEVEIQQAAAMKVVPAIYASRRFANFFNAYAKAVNNQYGRTGSLFQHPFGRVPVHSERQFWNIVAYIHQNPQKHRFVEDFREWRWSSYGAILADRTTKLHRAEVLDWFGGKEQYRELHAQWVKDCACAVDDED